MSDVSKRFQSTVILRYAQNTAGQIGSRQRNCNDALLVERVKKLVLSTEFSYKVNTPQ